MDAIFSLKFKSWMLNAVKTVKETGVAQDLHIDELFDTDFKKFTQEEIFTSCCSILKLAVDYSSAMEIDFTGINMYLSIDLVSENNSFIGRPVSEDDIVKAIDTYFIPEIIIYKEQKSPDVPLIELYRCPIFYGDFKPDSEIILFYKEYRELGDLLNNDEYKRELNIVARSE